MKTVKYNKLIRLALVLTALAALTASAAENPHKVVWQTTLAEVGQSGVCIRGDHLFIISFSPIPVQSDTQRRAAKGKGIQTTAGVVGQCFDKKTGKLLWEVPLSNTEDRATSVLGLWGGPTALTPVATDEYVVFYNPVSTLLCCDKQGQVIWRRTFKTPEKLQRKMHLYLHQDKLITALPAAQWSKKQPFYQLRAIDLSNGKDIWVADKLQGMASSYAPARWQGQDVMLSSRMSRAHVKFKDPNEAFAISLDNGKTLAVFRLPTGTSPHHMPMTDGKHLILNFRDAEAIESGTAIGEGRYLTYYDMQSGKPVRRIPYSKPEDVQYFKYGPEGYQESPYVPAFAYKGSPYGPKNQIISSTLRVFEGKAFYLTYCGNALGCIDLESGHNQIVDLPLQVLEDKTVWDHRHVNLFGGIRNTNGVLIRDRKFGNGRSRQDPTMGGFGHGLAPGPVRYKDKLYWQGGLGVIYMVDLKGEFTPDKVSWTALSSTESHWCFGALAVDDTGVYARSHKTLFKLNHSSKGISE